LHSVCLTHTSNFSSVLCLFHQAFRSNHYNPMNGVLIISNSMLKPHTSNSSTKNNQHHSLYSYMDGGAHQHLYWNEHNGSLTKAGMLQSLSCQDMALLPHLQHGTQLLLQNIFNTIYRILNLYSSHTMSLISFCMAIAWVVIFLHAYREIKITFHTIFLSLVLFLNRHYCCIRKFFLK